jgi:hypothetical protein
MINPKFKVCPAKRSARLHRLRIAALTEQGWSGRKAGLKLKNKGLSFSLQPSAFFPKPPPNLIAFCLFPFAFYLFPFVFYLSSFVFCLYPLPFYLPNPLHRVEYGFPHRTGLVAQFFGCLLMTCQRIAAQGMYRIGCIQRFLPQYLVI